MGLVEQILSAPSARVAAIDDRGGEITYGELVARAQASLETWGYGRQLILLEGQNSIDWLVTYVAGLLGTHPLLIAPGNNPGALAQLERAFPPAIRLLAANDFAPCFTGVDTCPLHPDLALLLSTSGSTGSPKCVRLSAANLAANAGAIVQYLEIGADERGVASLPTHYSYGLSIVNSHLHAGATLLLTSGSFMDPEFWDFCEEHRATSFAGVPHSYEMLARQDLAACMPSSLRYFTQAGGRLPEALGLHFANLAADHGWRFYIMYGQTEATARMAYLPPAEAVRRPSSIGIAIPGGAFRLMGEDGQSIEGPNTVGELVYKGPNVMMGYATEAIHLADGAGSAELRTGDLAMRDEEGFLRITGRLSRFIKIFGNRIGLDDVEVMLGAAGLSGLATGIDDQLLVVTRNERDRESIEQLVSTRLKLPPPYFCVRIVDEYPLLPSGKIDYAALKASIPSRTFDACSAGPDTVSEIFHNAFGPAASAGAATFLSLGGDSLNYIVVALALERLMGELPEGWPALPIATLAKIADQRTITGLPAVKHGLPRNLDTLRAAACLLVVMYHVIGDTPSMGLRLPSGSAWHYVADSFDYVRMPLFTAMAGFLYAITPATRGGLATFLSRKATMLLPPLVFLTLVTWASRHAFYGERGGDLAAAFLNGYLHLWYLDALLFIFLVVGIVDAFIGRSWGLWAFILVLAAGLRLVLPHIALFSIGNALRIIVYFILGMLIERRPGMLCSRALLAASAATAVMLLAAHQLILLGRLPHVWALPLSFPCGCAIVLLSMRLVPRSDILERVAPYSFAIYLWHPIANGLVRQVLIKTGVHDLGLLFAVGMIAGIAIPILLQNTVLGLPRWIALPVIGRMPPGRKALPDLGGLVWTLKLSRH